MLLSFPSNTGILTSLKIHLELYFLRPAVSNTASFRERLKSNLSLEDLQLYLMHTGI